ncbi:heparan-alpha-glucosaminide N-acetyltransferase domain-containing protein [Tropicimonas sp. IMCC6043]|uniref:heparan-alpha-glucosaminide N-acetyltransferase domain-containing protein n=1 Tax=Tropicimonas sp. IMCC6043 TaxID=2510645 RepID=UPI00101D52E9|nr:DUF1624 domain-containing protein [Tropicimonas sp. IMCC6043]
MSQPSHHTGVERGIVNHAAKKHACLSCKGRTIRKCLRSPTAATSLDLSPWWVCTGLTRNVPPSVGFIPIVPWLAPYLAGMAVVKALPPAKLESS